MATTERIIRKLNKRELELVMQAAQRVEAAQNAHRQAQAQAQLLSSQYLECIELLTGDSDPSSLSVDIERKVIFRTLEEVSPKGRGRRATTKGKKSSAPKDMD